MFTVITQLQILTNHLYSLQNVNFTVSCNALAVNVILIKPRLTYLLPPVSLQSTCTLYDTTTTATATAKKKKKTIRVRLKPLNLLY